MMDILPGASLSYPFAAFLRPVQKILAVVCFIPNVKFASFLWLCLWFKAAKTSRFPWDMMY